MLEAVEPATFPWGDYRRYTFSLALRSDAEAILSGQTAATFDPEQRRVTFPRGVTAQAEVVYDKIEAVLASAGFATTDVVRVVEYIVADAIADTDRLREVRTHRLASAAPAVTTLCVDRLLRGDALVEVAVAAQRNPGRGRETVPEQRMAASPLHLPTIMPKNHRGTSMATQLDATLDEADRVLAANDASWSDVVFALEHVAVGAEALPDRTILDRTDRLGTGRIAGARVGMRRLAGTDATFQLDLVVSRGPVEVIDADEEFEGPATLAAAVRVPGRIYLSGHGGRSTASGAPNARVEAESAYRRLLQTLDRAGGRPEDLIETIDQVTHGGLATYNETASVRELLLPRPFTAATGTVCAALDAGQCFSVWGVAMAGRG